jgi:uncharacterized membrane protein
VPVIVAARIVFMTALVVWVGQILCVSFVVAPALFQTLPVEMAGRAVSVIFRRYYAIGCGAGLLLVCSAVVLATAAARGPWLAAGAIGSAMLAMTTYAAFVVLPRADTLRPHLPHGAAPRAEAQAEFDRLHRRAVQLNALTLLGGLGVLGLAAVRLRG